MAHSIPKTKTAKIQNSNLFTFFATLSGVVVGVVASLAMMGPMVQSEVASATRALNARPVSSTSECVSSNDVGGASSTAKVPAPAPETGGSNGGNNGGGGDKNVIVKIIGGQSNKTVASMNNTGPDSTNIIKTINKNTTTITNNNDVYVSNNNEQNATSGSANVSGNTNGGSANSGKADNTNATSTDINISN